MEYKFRKIEGEYPLNESQKGVYFECVENPSSTAYNLPFVIYLPKECDIEKFEKAVQECIYKHPAFSAEIIIKDGTPFMRMSDNPAKVERTSAQSCEEAFERFIRPFELEEKVFSRFELCDTPCGMLFLFDIHHLFFDGTSFGIMLADIIKRYNGEDIEDEELTLFDQALKETGVKETPKYKEALEFFKEQFEGAEYDTLILPDVKRPSKTGFNEIVIEDTENISFEAVDGFTEKLGIRKNTLFVAAFAYALTFFTGAKDSFFTSVSRARNMEGLENTVGMFVKTFPLHFEIDHEQKVFDYLKAVEENFYSTLKHDIISFGDIAAEYGLNTDISFVYQSRILPELDIEGVETIPVKLPRNENQGNIIFMMMKQESGYQMHIQYRPGLYTRELISSIAETVFKVISGLLSCETLKDITLISSRMKAFTEEINSTQRPASRFKTLNEAFEETVSKHPDNTAVYYEGKTYSYKEMDDITSRIAAYIASKGLGKDDFVPVLAGRNHEMIISAWGVIRSGAAFEPLDPTYPAERLNFMVKDCSAKLVIADRNLIHILDEYHGDIIYTDELETLPEVKDFRLNSDPDSAITIIYTSGTTGRPKGCILENRNMLVFVENHLQVMDIDENSRLASYASFGFDAGVMDIVSTLAAGAGLYIIPDEIRLDFAEIDNFYCEHEITHGFMTTQVSRMFVQQTRCKTLKAFLAGGEKLVPFNPPKGLRFINGYGPCETMAYICCHEVEDDSPLQPIGKPLGNVKLYVADSYGRQLPLGGAGELCISGPQVGRGYLGLPEKTKEVFCQNPFTVEKGYERIYKTGDVVRLLTDGNMEFIGRRDSQVKVRGFRVELTEVEEIIRRFEGINDATVAAFDDASGGKYLAAYVTSEKTLDINQIKSFILEEKPPYMVPKVIMQIESIPYTQNQKVNKRALPKPVAMAAEDIVKPENEIQQKIFDIAAEILGTKDFGINTDLFDAGLSSIGTIKLNAQLGKHFNVPVKISEIRDNSTIKMLASLFGNTTEERAEIEELSVPIMKNQMGVFIESSSEGESLSYNIPVLMKLSDRIDAYKLAKAVEQAIDAHPFIKARLNALDDGTISAVKNDNEKALAEIIECMDLPSKKELLRPFKLLGEKLYRAEIYITEEGKYFFFDIHHVLGDGTSIAILLMDISEAYLGKTIDKEYFTGFDACLEEEKLLNSNQYKMAEQYYEYYLSGCNITVPGRCPEDKEPGVITYERKLEKCSEKIIAYCKDNKITPNAFFNAVFSYVLALFTHSDEVTYCTVYNGRNDSRLMETFSMLVKTLPVRCMVLGNTNVKEFAMDMQTKLLDTMSNDSVSFAELAEKYDLSSEVFFNYQGDNFIFDSLGGEEASLIDIETDEAKAPIAFELFLENGIFRLKTDYCKDCYCNEFVTSFASAFEKAAEGFIVAEALSEVDIFSDEEKEAFNAMNDTDRPFENGPAQSLFERCAKENPDKAAVKTKEMTLSYGELERKANALAHFLVKKGIGREDIVGMILDRTELVPICELGILKAGGAFLPMLPTYPDDRLLYSMTDSGCKVVLTTSDILNERKDLFSEDKEYLSFDVRKLIEKGEENPPEVEIIPQQLAYCIYTSGSTGTPKGVMIEHQNLTCFNETSGIADIQKVGNVILCMSSISFDMSLSEIFLSLSYGNTIYIAKEEEIHNLDLLLKAFKKNSVDYMIMTPSFAWNLLSLPEFEEAISKFNGIILGAEAFHPALFDKLKSLNKDMVIMNGYGPTEATQACSAKVITDGTKITIGAPSSNAKYYVMDVNGNLLPRYAVGELIICGKGVGRGYINLPEKNKEAFFEIDGVKAYKSGDLVRINRDGEAEFGGRADNQVKLRGFRIELDEVEAVMIEFDGVSQSKVLVRNNGTEDFLAGFFTAEKPIDIDELTAYMKTKLNYYMIPAAMMQLDRMPMTPNGKLDKKALPEISYTKKARVMRECKTSLEEKILGLIKTVLDNEDCYPEDNFFELGGTSLSASKVVMQIKAEGYSIEYQDIFDHQSAAELASYLDDSSPVSDFQDVTEEDKTGEMDVLRYNALEYAKEVERKPLGDILLTGATGFLGAHVLKALLEKEEGRIICLMRKGNYEGILTRLKAVLVYYFEEDFAKEFENRIMLVEGDITSDNLSELFENISFDTVINCAASVKHYANDNSIEFINVHGVENLIELAKQKDAKMIQISTTSVPGAHTDDTYRINLKMTEDKLFVINDMNNQYVKSKYQAELKVLEAVRQGMKGKVIRVGNLMGRYSDGEFQTNMRNNAFLNGLRGFAAIGKCPISHATDPMSFSPVDCTAEAIVLLSGTNDKFTAFHVESRSHFDEMKLIEAVNACGIKITPVPDEEYYADFNRFMADPKTNQKVSALLTNDRPDLHLVEADNRFTANILYRLGFSWPFIESRYLEKVITSLDELDFFFLD